MMISLWKQFQLRSCRRTEYTMKSMEMCAFLTIGIAITHIADAYPATSIRGWCDSKTTCDQEMVCIKNKCLSIDAIVSAYGPVKVISDGGWCSSSNACTQDMLCINNECIDRNRNWGSEISNGNNVESFDVRMQQINIGGTPSSNNSIVESTPVEHLLGQHERSDEWNWN